MNLWDIARKVGGSIIKAVVPGGGLLLDVVNELLPEGKKLGADATGTEMEKAIEGMSGTDRRILLEREFDVDETQIRESHDTLRTMLDSDAKNPHTTRPYIAKHAFHIIAIANLVAIVLWAYGIIEAKTEMVKTVTEGWPFILAVIGPLVTLLLAYFGILKQEHKNRLDAADTKPQAPTGIAGLIGSLIKR